MPRVKISIREAEKLTGVKPKAPAKKKKRLEPLEKDIQSAILKFLQLHRVFAWRQNSGAMTGSYKGKSRFVRFTSITGVSDIIGMTHNGRFIAIEVKRKNGKLRPEQEQFIDKVNQNGGLAFVARSVDDVETALRKEGVIE